MLGRRLLCSISLNVLGKGSIPLEIGVEYIPDLSARRDGRCKLIVVGVVVQKKELPASRLMNANSFSPRHVSGCKAVVGSKKLHRGSLVF